MTVATFQNGVSPDAGYAGWIDSSIGYNDNDAPQDTWDRVFPGWYVTEKRALFRIDLSSIPTNAVVTAATFSFLEANYNDGTDKAWLHAIAAHQFVENSATWNKYDGSNAWTTPGGDLAASAAQTGVTVPADDWAVFGSGGELNALVQQWISYPATNLGFVLGCDASGSPRGRYGVCSSERATLAHRPKAAITYTAGILPFIMQMVG
jgi:hypothetical protein